MPDHQPAAAAAAPVVIQQPVGEMVPAGGQVQTGNIQGAPPAGSPSQG